MSKKNVALIVIIVCFFTIMIIALLGNEDIVGRYEPISSVDFYDKNGESIKLKYFLDTEEVIEEVDEIGTKYYIFASSKQALDNDQILKLSTKYFIDYSYGQDDLIEIDGKRYVYTAIYAIINPYNTSYPRIIADLSPHMSNTIEQKLENETKDNGKDVDYITITLGKDDPNKTILPFAEKLEEKLESGQEQSYTLVKYGIYILFEELGEYDEYADPDDENSYRSAIIRACELRSGSVDIDFRVEKNSDLKIPTLTYIINYQKTAQEIASTSEDLSQY